MSIYKIDLCHLGDACAPGIIINHILNIKKKTLFMLAVYHFNDIITYLNDNNYENIYNTDLLDISKYPVINIKYNFNFVHDYVFENNKIINYDFIKDRFNTKIRNFKEMLMNKNLTIFINFTYNSDILKIDEMLNWLKSNKENFFLIIFNCGKKNNLYENLSNLSIIQISSYNRYWEFNPKKQAILYKEIYTKFISCLKNKNINHDFPTKFEDTSYYKDIINNVPNKFSFEIYNKKQIQNKNKNKLLLLINNKYSKYI